MRKVIRRYFDYDDITGEVVRTDEYPLQHSLMMKNSSRKFVKSFTEINPEYDKDAHLGYFSKLIRFLEQNTNRLVIQKSNLDDNKWVDNHPLTNSDMMGILSCSRTTLFRFLSESKKIGTIRKIKTEDGDVYYVNPAYCCNGNGVTPELYLIFEGDNTLESQITSADKKVIQEYLGVFKKQNIENV